MKCVYIMCMCEYNSFLHLQKRLRRDGQINHFYALDSFNEVVEIEHSVILNLTKKIT